MTAHAMTGDREQCIDAGMDDYIAKPIASAQLIALVESRAGHPDAEAPGGDRTAGLRVIRRS